MKIGQHGRTGLAGMAWLAFVVGSAQGATITETTAFTIQAPAASNLAVTALNVGTPQFNPTLGTFESGTTVISGTTSIDLEFFNTGAGGAYDVLVSDTLSLTGIPALFIEELTGTIPANQVAFIAPPVTFPFGPVERGDPAGLVVGPGTWNQLFSLPFPSLTIKQGPTALLPAIIISGSSVTTYSYTPAVAPVPEPASVALFGTGIAGLLLLTPCARRR
jgi:PEP-CTERM motif-containing protein